MAYNNVDDLVRKLSLKTDKEATKELTKFFALPRFALTDDDFDRRYCDGSNDGGVEIFNEEGPVSYIVQSKFTGTPRSIGSSTVLAEIRKVINTLTNQNPNHRAEAFVNAVRHGSNGPGTLLEFIFSHYERRHRARLLCGSRSPRSAQSRARLAGQVLTSSVRSS